MGSHKTFHPLAVFFFFLANLSIAATSGAVRVACLGDSITAGARGKGGIESYPAQLQRLLGSSYDVQNFGLGGATLIKRGRPSVWEVLPNVKAFRPQIIIIQLGTNDTVSGRRRNWERIVDFPGDYRALIKDLAALPSGARIFVCTPTDMVLETDGLSAERRANLEERRPRLEQLCEQVRKIAREQAGQNVGLVELHPVLRGKPHLLTPGDGVHPNAAGYRAIAEALAPHVRRAVQRPEGGYILRGARRSLEEIDRVYATMPPVTYTPPAGRWEFLRRTMEKIRAGSTLRIVMLGDSIINDTARSAWHLLLERQYPRCRVEMITSVRGSTGCWWYKEGTRVEIFVTDHYPDLVVIGGISQREDTGAIRQVIEQIRARSRAEILLLSGPFGNVDPIREEDWKPVADPRAGTFRSRLARLAAETHVEFMDLKGAWGEYIRGAGKDLDWFKRDQVHANERGEQILGRILASYFAPEAPQDSGPPCNIVFFFVDDMGWQDTSVAFHTERTELNRRYRTPNMERLADEGMKFTQAYACAVCSPSRVSLMTGMNAARHMVTNWTLRKDRQPDRRHRSVKAARWNVNGLSPVPGVERAVHATTLPMLLKKAGYRTIHCGKAHFGASGTPGADPLNLGFDVNIAGHAAGGPGSYYGKHNFSAAWRGGDRIWDVPGLARYHRQDVYLTEVLTQEAIKAIDKAVADGVPFYLYMSHYAIHAPWEKDPRFHDRYVKAGLKGLAATYASMIESMDKSLGDLMACLASHSIEESTVVVFMSDNGQPKQVPRNKPLRGHKLTPYEGGVRVPMIVKWPGVVRPGSVCDDQYVIVEDIFPTFLEIAGVKEYKQVGGKIDGVTFTALLCQSGSYPRERAIFWHYPNTYDQPPYSAVRKGDWKLIYHHITRKLELYDLGKDIGERNDLASTDPAKTRELSVILSDHLRDTRAGMTVDRSTNQPVAYPDQGS